MDGDKRNAGSIANRRRFHRERSPLHFQFLLELFLVRLLLQLNNGDGLAAAFLLFKGMFFNQGVGCQKLPDAFA